MDYEGNRNILPTWLYLYRKVWIYLQECGTVFEGRVKKERIWMIYLLRDVKDWEISIRNFFVKEYV